MRAGSARSDAVKVKHINVTRYGSCMWVIVLCPRRVHGTMLTPESTDRLSTLLPADLNLGEAKSLLLVHHPESETVCVTARETLEALL